MPASSWMNWALWLTFFLGFASAEQSFTLSAVRAEVDPLTENAFPRLRSRSGHLPTVRDNKLYWFGNFKVGDSNLKLSIDTGSSDLIIVPGVYKPSPHQKPYGSGNFSTEYEGVDKAGFGFLTINGTTYLDTVSAGGLTVVQQAIGNVTSFHYFDVPHPRKAVLQGDGIIGFGPSNDSSFTPQADSWFTSLCKTNAIATCEFGLAFGTSGRGQVIVGKVANDLIDGDLTEVPQKNQNFYFVTGDITLDNEIIASDMLILMDVGTNNIQSSLALTKKIFKKVGIKPIVTGSKKQGAIQVNGYFPCDKPPILGASFPAQSELKPGQKARIFNISPQVWDVYDHGNNNCTSILGGTSVLDKDGPFEQQTVLLGQPFFEGHYINFDDTTGNIGYGNLKDPSMSSST